MSKINEMIQLLDSISSFNTYSKYSNLLSKIFKNNSIKGYVSSLKYSIKDNQNYKKERKEIFSKKNKNKLTKKKELDLLNDEPEEEKNSEGKKSIPKKENLFKTIVYNKNIIKDNDFADPFKYEPNYNSIFKNVRTFKIVSHNTIPLKPKFTMSDYKKKAKIFDLKLNINNDDYSVSKKKSEEYKSLSSDTTKFTNKKELKNKYYKTLPKLNSFSTTKKNFMKTKFNFNQTSKINSRNTNNLKLLYNNKKKCFSLDKNNIYIDFKKMKKRSSKHLIYKQILLNPSFGYYNPNYNSIERKPMNIFFNITNTINKNSKKFRLQKVMSSYNVVKEYLTIDNNKL